MRVPKIIPLLTRGKVQVTRSLVGLVMAMTGAVLITPDTLLIRLSGLDGWGLTFWRGLLIGLSLLVMWCVMERRRVRSRIKRLARWPALVIVIANIINSIAFNFAVIETSVTIALTTLATVPLIAAALGFLVLGERAPMRTWIAIAVTFTGVMIVILNGDGALNAPAGNAVLGGVFGIISTLGIAVTFVVARKYPSVPVLPACAIGTLISALVAIPLAQPGSILTGNPVPIILMGCFIMPVSWGLLAMAPRYTSATIVSLFMLLEMVLGPFWVWLGTGERPGPAMIAGACLVLATLITFFVLSARDAARVRSQRRKS